MSAAEPLLDVKGLRTWFPVRSGIIPKTVANVKAVDDVSFSVATHEVLGVAGESGSGKTTLGRSILRLIEPTTGEIRFDRVDITQLNPGELRLFRRRAQIIFQDPFASLDPKMTIEEALAEPLRIQRLCKTSAERRDRVAELLESVAMSTEYLKQRPHALSGGQRQRIAKREPTIGFNCQHS